MTPERRNYIENYIIKITKLEGISITNTKEGGMFRDRKILYIYLNDGKKYILELIANVDITEKVMNHELLLNINENKKKEKTLWKED
jgi:hypothetical protein